MPGFYDIERTRLCGLTEEGQQPEVDRKVLHQIIKVKLAAQGYDVPVSQTDNGNSGLFDLAGDLFNRYAEQSRLLTGQLSPADKRIQVFLDDVLSTVGEKVTLPSHNIYLDRYRLAREMSLPESLSDYEFHNEEVSSYRLKNGILNNPLNDRRTTKGVFHVADYGLPIPADKIKIPLVTYGRMLKAAFNPPSSLLKLPFSSKWDKPVETMVSLLLRPLVMPEVPGVRPETRLEVRFFVPGGLVSNLDFVESIFGNAGDPNLPENDSALDIEHWTGHTGCVVLAPHLRKQKKKDVGLPHVDDATDEQKATGMCWSDPEELYNGGSPFKITMRDERGIMVTILADNYYGYCKKEVKTQIGLSANLSGLAEEEHAGGALAFGSYQLGQHLYPTNNLLKGYQGYKYEEALKLLGDSVVVHPEGYASDKRYPNIHILPENTEFDHNKQEATYTSGGQERSLRILSGHHYIYPSGFKVRLEKHPGAPSWRMVGTVPEGTFCHKPSTVSGGGKSEISKSLNDAVIYGPVFIGDYEEDMKFVEKIVERDYAGCILPEHAAAEKSSARPILSDQRSLGSVIKLLTPDEDLYTDEHNDFVKTIPNRILAIVFAIKRFYKPEWGKDLRSHFSVDIMNGAPGHELKLEDRNLVGSYLRVGLWKDGSRRNYKLRQDFLAADKVQMEDDITASTVVPREQISGLPSEYNGFPCLKIAQNCEWRLFQRPDDAIYPGYDKQTEIDFSEHGLFCSNIQPLSTDEIRDLTEQVHFFGLFTEHMKKHMLSAVKEGGINVCSAKPRIWEGKPTKNPRYLQVRPDVAKPQDRYIAELGSRLYRRISVNDPCVFPVAGIIGGRRNNPPDSIGDMKIRPLCVFNPIHYQETPELFMDYVCSVTGKSPSTTGAGSEGALTKAPFNAIFATADLNNAMVSFLLTGYGGFSSAAGYIGSNYKVDHDISLLIPELWCRLSPEERDPKRMIARGELEKVDDFEFEGRTIPASRLGYRITKRFVLDFCGKVFDNSSAVFPDDILKPETQDLAVFADGIENIADAQARVAKNYFKDGAIEDACPPLKVVLHVMAYGHYEGKQISDPKIRAMFTRENMLKSDWYKARLATKQKRDIALWGRHIKSLEAFMNRRGYEAEAARLKIAKKLHYARKEFERVSSPKYLTELEGTIGADPVHGGYPKAK